MIKKHLWLEYSSTIEYKLYFVTIMNLNINKTRYCANAAPYHLAYSTFCPYLRYKQRMPYTRVSNGLSIFHLKSTNQGISKSKWTMKISHTISLKTLQKVKTNTYVSSTSVLNSRYKKTIFYTKGFADVLVTYDL